MGILGNSWESVKRGSQGRTSPYPVSRWYPRGGRLPSDTKIGKERKKEGERRKKQEKGRKEKEKGGKRERIKQVKKLDEKSSENIYFVKKGVFFDEL